MGEEGVDAGGVKKVSTVTRHVCPPVFIKRLFCQSNT